MPSLAEHFGDRLVRELIENDFKSLFASKKNSPNHLSKTDTLLKYVLKIDLILVQKERAELISLKSI